MRKLIVISAAIGALVGAAREQRQSVRERHLRKLRRQHPRLPESPPVRTYVAPDLSGWEGRSEVRLPSCMEGGSALLSREGG
jgi:hypothetical protein